MTKTRIKELYFNWMCNLVYGEEHPKGLSYQKLLQCLDDTPFIWIISMDSNRAADGIDLRYRFGYENDIPQPEIGTLLDDHPCSVLEMMVALSIRCEEHIMNDPEIGNRTGQWFWNMIVNLGLGSMTDAKFDEKAVHDIVHRFLYREYKPNGEGGLFKIPSIVRYGKFDIRTSEIWYQAMWYLDWVLKN